MDFFSSSSENLNYSHTQFKAWTACTTLRPRDLSHPFGWRNCSQIFLADTEFCPSKLLCKFFVSINPSHSLAPVWGVCYFLGSVLSQQKFEATEGPVLQLHITIQFYVTTQFYLESKGKYILQSGGHANPKDWKRRKAPWPSFGFPFYMFFSPPPEPALCKLV